MARAGGRVAGRDGCVAGAIAAVLVVPSLAVPWLAATVVAPRAGAWTLEPGTGQVIVAVESKIATGEYDGSGRLVARPRFAKSELSAYAEYGLLDGLTVLFSPRLEDVNDSGRWGGARTGLGYTELGARARFVRFEATGPGVWRGAVASMQGSLRVPGSVVDNDPLLVGNNVAEVDARLLFGASFAHGAWSSFVNAEAGYRWRDGAPPSELRGDLTVGVRPKPDWLAMAQLFQVTTVGEGRQGFRAGAYTRLQFSLVHDLDARWSVQVGANSVVAGRRALAENGVLLAVWRRF